MEELILKRVENFKSLIDVEKEIELATKLIASSLKNEGKILFCGNGGSASDSNHLAAEFISKFKKERKSLPAISLSANNSIITAIANDYSFDDVFKRQLEGLGKRDDVLYAITTSGKSKNVIEAIKKAKQLGIKTILLTGKNKTDLKCDVEINAPSDVTAEIQEMHIAIGHIICESLEKI